MLHVNVKIDINWYKKKVKEKSVKQIRGFFVYIKLVARYLRNLKLKDEKISL